MKENIPSKWQGNLNLFANPLKGIPFEFEAKVSLEEAVEDLRKENKTCSWFVGTKTEVGVYSARPDLYEFQISRYGNRSVGARTVGYLKRIDDTSVLISGKASVSLFFYLNCLAYLIFLIGVVLSTPHTPGFSIFIVVIAFILIYLWLRANYERIRLVNWLKNNLKKKSF